MAKLDIKNSFALARLIKELEIKDKLIEIAKENGNSEIKGADLVFTIIENLGTPEAEEAFFKFASQFLEIKINEIKEMELFEFVDEFMKAVNVEEWSKFFRKHFKN